MFDTILKDAYITTDSTLPIGNVIICLIVAMLLGIVLCGSYIFVTYKTGTSQSFCISMIVLPVVVAAVVILVGGNIARAFSMAGVFTLVRFRSMPGDSKDLSFVFGSMAIGIASGLGYLTIAASIALFLAFIFIVTNIIGLGKIKIEMKMLKIVIPEDLNYTEVFNDIFAQYIKTITLQRVKTTNLGALYELSYLVTLKKDVSEKNFLDELRTRNGNLSIMISTYDMDKGVL